MINWNARDDDAAAAAAAAAVTAIVRPRLELWVAQRVSIEQASVSWPLAVRADTLKKIIIYLFVTSFSEVCLMK